MHATPFGLLVQAHPEDSFGGQPARPAQAQGPRGIGHPLAWKAAWSFTPGKLLAPSIAAVRRRIFGN